MVVRFGLSSGLDGSDRRHDTTRELAAGAVDIAVVALSPFAHTIHALMTADARWENGSVSTRAGLSMR